MNEQQYRQAQQSLLRTLASGGTYYINAANCLTVIHPLAADFAPHIRERVIVHLRVAHDRHHWLPSGDLHITIRNVRRAVPGREVCSRASRTVHECSAPGPAPATDGVSDAGGLTWT